MSLIFPYPLNSVPLASIYPSRCWVQPLLPAADEPVLFADPAVDDLASGACPRPGGVRFIEKRPDSVRRMKVFHRQGVIGLECERCSDTHPRTSKTCHVGRTRPLHVLFFAMHDGVMAFVEGGEAGEVAEYRLRIHHNDGQQLIHTVEISVDTWD